MLPGKENRQLSSTDDARWRPVGVDNKRFEKSFALVEVADARSDPSL
jgi:hypothetical protein